MDQKHKYFLVKGGVALEAIKGYQDRVQAFYDHGKAVATKYGATNWCYRGSFVTGLKFAGDPPKGWIVYQDPDLEGFWKPTKRGKAGKEAVELFQSVTRPHAIEFAGLLHGHPTDYEPDSSGRLLIRYPTYRQFGETFILLLPIAGDGSTMDPPEGCEEIKASEYWQIKEAHEAQKAEAA